MFMITRD